LATPEAGSFAKHTGLRRHMRGVSEIEGQDVDLPFVVKPKAKDGDQIGELLGSFDKYAALKLAVWRVEKCIATIEVIRGEYWASRLGSQQCSLFNPSKRS
jgi:hypothetical protein